VLGRRVTGAFFVFWEGLTITMTLKASHQLDYFQEVGTEEQIEAKKQEIQDWVVLLVFNHLLAGAEAFVSAYLWDFRWSWAAPAGRPGQVAHACRSAEVRGAAFSIFLEGAHRTASVRRA
jgi:hypothetical protein